jgi:hypothetical protein
VLMPFALLARGAGGILVCATDWDQASNHAFAVEIVLVAGLARACRCRLYFAIAAGVNHGKGSLMTVLT